jgi:hypothetical protein
LSTVNAQSITCSDRSFNMAPSACIIVNPLASAFKTLLCDTAHEGLRQY